MSVRPPAWLFREREWFPPARRAASGYGLSHARASQVVLESLGNQSANVRASQVVMEVLCSVAIMQPSSHISL